MTPSRYQDDDEWRDGDENECHDVDDSGDEPTVPCPFCRREILEDAPQCPYCRQYISDEDHRSRRQPQWIIGTAVICLGIAIWWAISTR
jgi:predicted nucleic acid-binding Zn ribbon protein